MHFLTSEGKIRVALVSEVIMVMINGNGSNIRRVIMMSLVWIMMLIGNNDNGDTDKIGVHKAMAS